jgi:deoxyribonuclease IV
MRRIGAHVSIAGGIENAPLNARKIGAKAYALFTKNQRQWKAKPLEPASIAAFKKNNYDAGFAPEHILPHDSYLINLCHPETAGLAKSREAFFDEMKRCGQLGLVFLNFHPGSHLGKMTLSKSLARISESINMALDRTRGVTAVIENTSGQGNTVGFAFEQLAEIIRGVEDKTRVGVCLDTCHAFTAGYDLRTKRSYEAVIGAFDSVVGLGYLKGLHLNDAKTDFNSRVDRHASLGKGLLGLEPFRFIMNDRRLGEDIPMILETTDPKRWPGEIRMLYGLVFTASAA